MLFKSSNQLFPIVIDFYLFKEIKILPWLILYILLCTAFIIKCLYTANILNTLNLVVNIDHIH